MSAFLLWIRSGVGQIVQNAQLGLCFVLEQTQGHGPFWQNEQVAVAERIDGLPALVVDGGEDVGDRLHVVEQIAWPQGRVFVQNVLVDVLQPDVLVRERYLSVKIPSFRPRLKSWVQRSYTMPYLGSQRHLCFHFLILTAHRCSHLVEGLGSTESSGEELCCLVSCVQQNLKPC